MRSADDDDGGPLPPPPPGVSRAWGRERPEGVTGQGAWRCRGRVPGRGADPSAPPVSTHRGARWPVAAGETGHPTRIPRPRRAAALHRDSPPRAALCAGRGGGRAGALRVGCQSGGGFRPRTRRLDLMPWFYPPHPPPALLSSLFPLSPRPSAAASQWTTDGARTPPARSRRATAPAPASSARASRLDNRVGTTAPREKEKEPQTKGRRLGRRP